MVLLLSPQYTSRSLCFLNIIGDPVRDYLQPGPVSHVYWFGGDRVRGRRFFLSCRGIDGPADGDAKLLDGSVR
jgi:hypothetical protein